MKRLLPSVDVLLVVCAAALVFWLQARLLHITANPMTDEGVHAEAGRMLWEGYVPYRDFAYAHPPLLPLLIGLGLKLFHGIYGVRLIYLFLNVFSAVPLYIVFKRIGRDAVAAFIAILFYLTYHEMFHHDARMLATRQLSDVLFVGFLWFAVAQPKGAPRFVLQSIAATLNAMLLYLSIPNLALASGAAILSARSRREKKRLFIRYAWMGLLCTAVLAVFFLTVPGSFEATVLSHFQFPDVPRAARILGWATWGSKDLLFYLLASVSLLVGSIFLKHIRWWCLAMLGMILMVLAPREFFPHYFVIAGPAFAFGVCVMTLLLRTLTDKSGAWLAYGMAILFLMQHLSVTLPSLLAEWNGNRAVDYYDLERGLSALPEPMLTFIEPMFAIDAGKTIVTSHYRPQMRYLSFFGRRLSDEEFESLAARACTIVLPPADQGFVPKHIQERWLARYVSHPLKSWVIVLTTGNDGCAPPFTPPATAAAPGTTR